MKKIDSIIDRAVKDQTIANLRRREAEIHDNIDFLSRLLTGEFDEPTELDATEEAPGDETEADAGDEEFDDDDWFYDEAGDDAAFDDVRLFEETEDAGGDEE